MKYLQCSYLNGVGGFKKSSRFKHERAIKRRQGKHTLYYDAHKIIYIEIGTTVASMLYYIYKYKGHEPDQSLKVKRRLQISRFRP